MLGIKVFIIITTYREMIYLQRVGSTRQNASKQRTVVLVSRMKCVSRTCIITQLQTLKCAKVKCQKVDSSPLQSNKNCELKKTVNLWKTVINKKTLSYKNWQLQKLTITKTVNYKNSELQKIVHYENSDSWKFWITKHMSYTNCKLQKLFVIKTVKPEYINIMYHWWEVDMDWKMCFEKKVYA